MLSSMMMHVTPRDLAELVSHESRECNMDIIEPIIYIPAGNMLIDVTATREVLRLPIHNSLF
ncbi:hypothetical protein J6590_038827 [Homalodisca vitripennis]|nr:hypothetical protein J6590_038827 [Homalodisca vitripennis]